MTFIKYWELGSVRFLSFHCTERTRLVQSRVTRSIVLDSHHETWCRIVLQSSDYHLWLTVYDISVLELVATHDAIRWAPLCVGGFLYGADVSSEYLNTRLLGNVTSKYCLRASWFLNYLPGWTSRNFRKNWHGPLVMWMSYPLCWLGGPVQSFN